MRVVLVIIICITSSCSVKKNTKNVNEYFISSGVSKYFLPQLPSWINFSADGQCKRKYSNKFLDFNRLMKSYQISYEQAYQLQIGLNLERQKLLLESQLDVLPYKELEKVFFNQTERVQSKTYSFQSPDFNQIHFIWIDPLLENKKLKKRYLSFFQSKAMDEGYPIFLSLCLTTFELEQWLLENIEVGTVNLLGFEVLSYYDSKGNTLTKLFVDLEVLVGSDKKIIFYSPEGKIPESYLLNNRASRRF